MGEISILDNVWILHWLGYALLILSGANLKGVFDRFRSVEREGLWLQIFISALGIWIGIRNASATS